MAIGDACLLDSNILLRLSKRDDPRQPVIARAMKHLIGSHSSSVYTSQTLGEFWNASTRPLDKNGFGLSVIETDQLARLSTNLCFLSGEPIPLQPLVNDLPHCDIEPA